MGRDQCMVWGYSEKVRLREKSNGFGKPSELQSTNPVHQCCQSWAQLSYVAIWFLVRVGKEDEVSIIESWLSCSYEIVRLSFKSSVATM